MTRKGLAIGAGIAMISSALIAAPAQAAGELTLEPAAGTSWSVPSTNGFGVKAYFTAGYSSSEAAKLKFRVTSAGGYKVDAATSTSAVYTASTDLIVAADTSGVSTTAGGSPTYAAFQIESASSSTTYSVTVQAFIDSDNDGVIDSGEWTSAVQTITYLKYADINWTVDIADPVRGATTSAVRVTSTNINLQQLTTSASGATQMAAVFYTGAAGTTLAYAAGTAATTSATYAVADGDSATVGLAWSSTNSRLEGTSPSHTAHAVADKVKVDVYFEATAATPNANTSANDPLDLAVGDSDGLLVATANDTPVGTRTESVPAAQLSALGAVASTASANNTATSSNAASVRTGATSLVATSTATLSAGVTSTNVTFTISEDSATSSGLNTIDAAASITAGGKTLKNANAGLLESVDVVVATDSDGVATLNMTLAGLKAGNKFTVVATAQGYTGTLATYTVADAVATSAKNLNAVGVNADSSRLVFPVGSGFDLRYAVLDQFGALLNVAGHSVTVSDGTNSWSASVSNGYATVSIPAYSAATTKTMTPTVYKNGADVTITEPTASVRIGTVTTVTAVTGTGDSGTASNSKKALNLKASKAADTRIGEVAPTVTGSTNVVITGSATDSNLDGVTTSVTLAAPGLMFEADGVWTLGSITVQTTAAGAYTVDVYSNTAGKKVVTITSGSATTTEELWFADAADDAGTKLALDVPASAAPGTTLKITGTLTDDFGNPVTADGTDEDFVLVYNGPGYAGSVPTSVSADGTFTYNVLLGSNDRGSATVTVAYDLDEDGDYTDTGDLVVTKTIVIGASTAAAVNVGSFNGKLVVYAKNLNGKKISWKVGGRWGTAVADSNFDSFARLTPRKGVTVSVEIYVDGVKTLTKSVVTK